MFYKWLRLKTFDTYPACISDSNLSTQVPRDFIWESFWEEKEDEAYYHVTCHNQPPVELIYGFTLFDAVVDEEDNNRHHNQPINHFLPLLVMLFEFFGCLTILNKPHTSRDKGHIEDEKLVCKSCHEESICWKRWKEQINPVLIVCKYVYE